SAVPLLRQGQHGRNRQEFYRPGERQNPNEWIPGLVGLGICSYCRIARATKSHACPDAMAMELLHRAAELPADVCKVAERQITAASRGWQTDPFVSSRFCCFWRISVWRSDNFCGYPVHSAS